MIFASDHQRLNKSSLLATSMRLYIKKLDWNERTVIPYGSFCWPVTPLSASLAFHYAINITCCTVIPFLWLLYATRTLLCCAVLVTEILVRERECKVHQPYEPFCSGSNPFPSFGAITELFHPATGLCFFLLSWWIMWVISPPLPRVSNLLSSRKSNVVTFASAHFVVEKDELPACCLLRGESYLITVRRRKVRLHTH